MGLRRHNEKLNAPIVSLARRALTSYVCECADGDCVARIELSAREYAAVRAEGARFAIAIHHEDPETDLLVDEGSRYATIEKLPGRASRMAVAADPRTLLRGNP